MSISQATVPHESELSWKPVQHVQSFEDWERVTAKHLIVEYLTTLATGSRVYGIKHPSGRRLAQIVYVSEED